MFVSENTNTLFWVITGAVIVVSLFVLIQGNVTGTVQQIFNHFNNLFT